MPNLGAGLSLLQTRDLGVLEDGCESFQSIHVAVVADVIACEAVQSVREASVTKSVRWTAITHVQKASTSPQRGHTALLEPVAERCDAFGGVGAVATLIDAAE